MINSSFQMAVIQHRVSIFGLLSPSARRSRFVDINDALFQGVENHANDEAVSFPNQLLLHLASIP